MNKRFVLSIKDLYTVFFVLLYRCSLDIVYYALLSKWYGYAGFNLKFDSLHWIVSMLLLLLAIPALFKFTKRSCMSDVIMLLLVYLSFIPFTTMVAFFPYKSDFIYANSIYWLLFFFLMRNLPVPQRICAIRTVDNDMVLTAVEALFAFVIIYISWRYAGFRFTISISNVYEYRLEAKMASIPMILRYLFAASRAVNPILLTYSMDRKKTVNVILLIVLQILSFSFDGSKTVLFTTLLGVLLYYFYTETQLKKIPIYMTGLCVLTFLETTLLHTIFLLAYLVRRVMFVPNQLSAYYFDFFTTHTPDYYRQSFLRFFGAQSPYIDIDHLIAAIYFGKQEMGANSGLISDAITNMGIAGIIIMPIILALLLRFMDSLAVGINKRIYILPAVTTALNLINSFLPTILLTHGLLALFLILALIPKNTEAKERLM